MSLDKAAVTKIAKLARIELEDAQKEHFASELSGIFKWIEQLNELDTEEVPQMVSVSETLLPWRKDEITDGHKREAVLANAPMSEYGCFVVPKVIE